MSETANCGARLNIPRSWYGKPWYIRAKQLLFECLYRCGVPRVFRLLQRKSVLVLTYHDVLPPGFPEGNPLFGMTVSTDEFEWQLDYVQKHYNPISSRQFTEWLLGAGSLPPRPVLVTFDDGHRNNLQYSLPSLQKRHIPAVCFVVAGNLGERKLTWVEEGYYRILFTRAPAWQLTTGESLPLKTKEEKSAACGRFFGFFRTLPEDAQQKEMVHLRGQLWVEEGDHQFPGRFEFLDASDLRLLRQNGIEIGAHSISHPVFATLNEQRVRDEVAVSKSRLEAALGTPIAAFAYPFGMPGIDFSRRDSQIVRQAGFSIAFAAHDGFVRRNSDHFALPRFGIGRMSRAQFAATVSGALSFLKNRFN